MDVQFVNAEFVGNARDQQFHPLDHDRNRRKGGSLKGKKSTASKGAAKKKKK